MKLELQHLHDDTWVRILTKWSYIHLEGKFILNSVKDDLMSKMKGMAHCVWNIEVIEVQDNSPIIAFTIVFMGAWFPKQWFTTSCMGLIFASN